MCFLLEAELRASALLLRACSENREFRHLGAEEAPRSNLRTNPLVQLLKFYEIQLVRIECFSSLIGNYFLHKLELIKQTRLPGRLIAAGKNQYHLVKPTAETASVT